MNWRFIFSGNEMRREENIHKNRTRKRCTHRNILVILILIVFLSTHIILLLSKLAQFNIAWQEIQTNKRKTTENSIKYINEHFISCCVLLLGNMWLYSMPMNTINIQHFYHFNQDNNNFSSFWHNFLKQ